MIDTLILSGGGPSGIAYIGIFKSLFDNNIINSQLKDIKEIITTSVGILFSILLMAEFGGEMKLISITETTAHSNSKLHFAQKLGFRYFQGYWLGQ